jgi:hypothetical protein
MYVHMYIYIQIHSQDCCGLRFHDSFAMADVQRTSQVIKNLMISHQNQNNERRQKQHNDNDQVVTLRS